MFVQQGAKIRGNDEAALADLGKSLSAVSPAFVDVPVRRLASVKVEMAWNSGRSHSGSDAADLPESVVTRSSHTGSPAGRLAATVGPA